LHAPSRPLRGVCRLAFGFLLLQLVVELPLAIGATPSIAARDHRRREQVVNELDARHAERRLDAEQPAIDEASERVEGDPIGLALRVVLDPARRLTTFDQRYLERRGGRTTEHAFELTFRTLSIPQMRRRLERAGFRVKTVLGDYGGQPWDARADVWILLAEKV
jgi:hypothetical protein